eukprot:Unigene10580_Nuclearia_a/m.32345 Unigene10580_Nuclearia_a/g.32345  ORF Unigene10580_Nuclearia_a/g.32345 Unigene10580_Nuclearia_a/m.32345 type:complete len:252 (+) Unigene10580_Nuclearia_a:3-758(+)
MGATRRASSARALGSGGGVGPGGSATSIGLGSSEHGESAADTRDGAADAGGAHETGVVASVVQRMTGVLERLTTLPPVWLMRSVAVIQLLACAILSLYCLFIGRRFALVDSATYYIALAPLVVAVMYAVRLPEPDVRRVRIVALFIAVTMLTGLLSSFFFMVKANEVEILRRECSLTVMMPLARYSSADCARMLADETGCVVRSAIFIVVQICGIHPAVSYLIETLRQREQLQQSRSSSTGTTTSTDSARQ